MDEHQGYFRLATTKGNMWDDQNPSENLLFVLNENLEVVTLLSVLAKGERIYSARFMGDRVYRDI
ncbi:beta-propeller domain-containing protein [Anaerobacillus sp. HL2]|nr:beta-propeller domain-containing protein [Anaerobacillus sp. HL2]